MTSTSIPCVNDTYFQHKVLTRIHGIPVYETLQLLTTEIKANAASVPTTLGGGHYGHLGLVDTLAVVVGRMIPTQQQDSKTASQIFDGTTEQWGH